MLQRMLEDRLILGKVPTLIDGSVDSERLETEVIVDFRKKVLLALVEAFAVEEP
jgi:hypothetical protein